MNQIFIANPKGGCGKTTIATQLAGYCANRGLNVLLVDHDAQRSSSDWLAGRPEKCPAIRILASSVDTPIADNAADIILHDMPAAWDLDHVSDIICDSDQVLIPVLSSPNDIKACLRFIMGLYRSGILEANIRIGLVANRVRMNTRYFQVLMEFLQRVELPMVASLRDTQNYVRVMDRGLSIFDLHSSKFEQDIEQWQPILAWLRLPQSSDIAGSSNAL